MIYLIGQLSLYLLVAFLFAAFAGWSFAAQRATPDESKRRRDRETLLRDIERYASGGAVGGDAVQAEREAEAARGLLSIRDARIAELESALERTRARADETAAELAEWQRREHAAESDASELTRLRALVATHDEERANEVEAEVEEVGPTETEILQSWRLRYFEQRVKYLEGLSQALAILEAPSAEPGVEWRLREAEARAAHLADEVRALSARAPAEEPRALAADADADMLLRWRMLYLERRAAHLQDQLSLTEPAPMPAAAPTTDPDLWKWRARYLEARVRHLETRPASAPAAPAPAPAEPMPLAAVEAPPPPAAPTVVPTVPAQKPPILAAARNGAPDDFTLIETISPMQQTMLNAIGIFHFDQIAAWDAANVAWVDRYFRLRGRVAEEEWVEQAADLAREGVHASRRLLASEDA
jgi:predicted flap endonuclease-1-like 5' DNA nuclease